MRLLPSAVVCFLSCFGGATCAVVARSRLCARRFGGGAPRCACGLYRFPTPPHAPSDAPLWRRGRPFLSPSQSREPHVSAFAPCERREVYGLPKHCFELYAPLSGARFPVLECPSLFAPLALSRCARLARRVFPGCQEAFSASGRNTTRKLTISICAVCQGRAAKAVASQTLTAALNCVFGYYRWWC